MLSRHGIIALAAGTSLLLHAVVLSSFRAIHVPVGVPYDKVERYEEMTVVYDPATHEPDEPDRDKPPPQEFEIGEEGAKGYASHKTEGDRTAVAREAPVDQAALSLDPVGTELRPEKPWPDPGDSREARPAPAPVVVSIPPVAAEKLRPFVASLPQKMTAIVSPPPAPDGERAAVEPAVPAVPPVEALVVLPAPTPPTPPAPPAVAAKAGSGGADPAPLSDSESDAFSVLGSANFVNGELRVRSGRKIRSRRPKIGLAGQLDAAYSRVEVTLRVAIDATGKVTAAEVVKSSGSNEIDQPCRVSMYDWWFEPKKDAAGKPTPDKFLFTIGFH